MSADFTPEKEDYKILTPFKMQVLTNFPYIEADFDALTNYQLLCKIVEYLNNVIHNENEVTEQVTSLYNAYVALQNYVNTYFDNLDLSGEVDRKIDELAEDGTLTNLIKDYVDPIYEAYETTINESISNQNTEISTFKTTVNSQINVIDHKVTSATSGSPKGVYANEAALIAADPDHDYIYLVSDTGYWYYYDTGTSSWTSGGVYQATGIDSDLENQIYTNKENINYITDINNNLAFDNVLVNSYYNDSHVLTTDNTVNTAIINSEKLKFVKIINGTSGNAHIRLFNNTTMIEHITISTNETRSIYLQNATELDVAFKNTEAASITVQNMYNFIDDKRKLLAANDPHATLYENGYFDDNFNLVTYSGVNTYLYDMEYYDKVIYSNISNTSSDVRIYDSNGTLISKDNGYHQARIYNSTDASGTIKYIAMPYRTSVDSSNYIIEAIPKFNNYYNAIYNSKDLDGKTITFVGDSITYGYDGANPGSRVSKPYPQIIHETRGSNSVNLGVNGSSLSTVDSGVHSPICNRLNNISDSTDIVVIFGGTNDYAFSADIGTFDSNDSSTIYGAIKTIVNYYYTNLLNKELFICTPLKRSVMNANSKGYTLEDYANAIKDACNRYSIPCIDLFNIGYSYPGNANFITYDLPDGLHPSQNYYYLLADVIAKKLK